MRSILRAKNFPTPSVFSPAFFYAQNTLCSSVHDESVNVYPHMYNGNVQQNCLCVEPVCFEFSMSQGSRQRFFPTGMSSRTLYAQHLRCKFSTPTSTSVCSGIKDALCAEPCVRKCS